MAAPATPAHSRKLASQSGHPGTAAAPAPPQPNPVPAKHKAEPTLDFTAPSEIVRVVAEGERLSFGHLFNPAFAAEISQIDPLPHQRIPAAKPQQSPGHQRRGQRRQTNGAGISSPRMINGTGYDTLD